MATKIRLGYFIFTSLIGGAETYLRDLIWGIDPERFEIQLYYPPLDGLDRFLGIGEGSPFTARMIDLFEPAEHLALQPEDGTVHPLRKLYRHLPVRSWITPFVMSNLRYWAWKRNVIRLTRLFSNDNLDVLHVINGGYPGAVSAQAAVVAAKRTSVSGTVMTVASTALPRAFALTDRKVDHQVNLHTDILLVPGEEPARALELLRGFEHTKIRKVFWGIESASAPTVDMILDARRRCGLPVDAHVVGTVANFVPYKGYGTLVTALRILSEKMPNVRALLIGDGPTRDATLEQASVEGLNGIATFPGRLDNVLEAIRALDVFVIASEIEGLPYVILEAMSQAKPVVATRVGGIPEAIVPGETGFLIEPGNASELATSIQRILENPELARRMGETGFARFQDMFTIEKMLTGHQSIYEEIANPH